MVPPERTSREWFEAAARCYVEKHQGCPWCGGSYRVFKTQKDGCLEYSCIGCDFLARYDEVANTYATIPGEAYAIDPPPPTMHAIEVSGERGV
jgi:hypothetical protein